ncbi:MAG: hypothetical protein K2X81_03875 [Candidatus Obscuribacterales bacterium]|nr:hypothetical protein [Candidatus Obscuribacterales bacterium]
MTKFRTGNTLPQPSKAARQHGSLAFYESQSVGNEFQAHIPKGDERRASVMRRDQVILKNWQSVPADRAEQCIETQRNAVSSMRDYETKRVLDSERMFVMVLASMTFLLGCIFLYFVMNFRF